MKKTKKISIAKLRSLKKIGVILILLLFFLNMYFFVKTMTLGDNLLKTEKEITQLKVENGALEKKLYSLNSFQHLQTIASQLGFVKKLDILYVDSLKYALRYE